MEKILFAEYSAQERKNMLSDNADSMEEVGYMKPFNPDEM